MWLRAFYFIFLNLYQKPTTITFIFLDISAPLHKKQWWRKFQRKSYHTHPNTRNRLQQRLFPLLLHPLHIMDYFPIREEVEGGGRGEREVATFSSEKKEGHRVSGWGDRRGEEFRHRRLRHLHHRRRQTIE